MLLLLTFQTSLVKSESDQSVIRAWSSVIRAWSEGYQAWSTWLEQYQYDQSVISMIKAWSAWSDRDQAWSMWSKPRSLTICKFCLLAFWVPHARPWRRPMLAFRVMNLFWTDIFLYVNLYRVKMFGTDNFLYMSLYRAKMFGTDILPYVNLYRVKAFGTDICLGQTSVWKKKISSNFFKFLHLFGCKQFH